MLNEESDGWKVWSMHIIKELERLSKAQEETNKRLSIIEAHVEGLQVKAGVWGVIGGFIPVSILLLMEFLKHKVGG